jgi:hypothetical protein
LCVVTRQPGQSTSWRENSLKRAREGGAGGGGGAGQGQGHGHRGLATLLDAARNVLPRYLRVQQVMMMTMMMMTMMMMMMI